MELNDRVVVITGGGSGIGEALARAAHREGARHVVVADLDGAAAQRVARQIAGTGVELDVRDEAAIVELVATTEDAHGPIDLFASNAGYVTVGGRGHAAWQRSPPRARGGRGRSRRGGRRVPVRPASRVGRGPCARARPRGRPGTGGSPAGIDRRVVVRRGAEQRLELLDVDASARAFAQCHRRADAAQQRDQGALQSADARFLVVASDQAFECARFDLDSRVGETGRLERFRQQVLAGDAKFLCAIEAEQVDRFDVFAHEGRNAI